MKILAISGSARRGGNTEVLIREALRGADADAEPVVLAELKFGGCLGCRSCREEGAEGCVQDDDMQGLYDAVKGADALILGSPIYYGEVTGQMKCFMDRWYALRDMDRALRIGPGKKALFIMTQGAEGEETYAHARSRIERILRSYEMRPEVVVAAGVDEKGEAAGRADVMRKARSAGERLAADIS